MKKKISFLVSLMLVVAAGFYFAPEYSNAGDDDDKACCIVGYTGQSGDSIVVRLGSVVVSTCESHGAQGIFYCCGLDPNTSYTVAIYRNDCVHGSHNITCKDVIDLRVGNPIWDCF